MMCLHLVSLVACLLPFLSSTNFLEPTKKLELVPGKFGKALDAQATPTSVEGSDKYRQPPLTVECWVKLKEKQSFNVIIASDPKSSARHWEIYSYAGSGSFSAYLPGYEPSEIVSKRNIVDGFWHFVAMTFDGKIVRLFVDGKRVLEQPVTLKKGLQPVNGPLMLGQAVEADQRIGCVGLIDDVRISNVIRSSAAMPDRALPHDPQTIGLWRFDEEEGLTADPAWTPPPVLGGKVEAWERATDADWIDPRFRKMDKGNFQGATFEYPGWRGKEKVFKGISIRVGDNGEAAVLFERNQLRIAAGWTGNYLNLSDKRFGLMNTPTPAGTIVFATSSQPGWSNPGGDAEHLSVPATAPLPRAWGHYKGLFRHGARTVLSYKIGDADVLESPWFENGHGQSVLTRTIEISSSANTLRLLADEFPADVKQHTISGQTLFATRHNGVWHFVALVVSKGAAVPRILERNRVEIELPGSKDPRRFKVLLGTTSAETLDDVAALIKASPPSQELRPLATAGPAHWTKPIVTRGEAAKDSAPFVVDTLTIPYENPYNALFFVTGIDFLPDGSVAVCTAHGDVWIVTGADDKLEAISWKRFATGLYQPLGLKVIDGAIVVLERGQLTRLHDLNNDGEADYYENVNNDWHCSGGEHSYDTCLETDLDGNFYFFKTGDHDTPTGGCLMRVSKDGVRSEIYATGFRHPIGLGVSPEGLITGADQEGNWMPATRIDVYKKGGFYGDMRTHHRSVAPKIYDPPLLWLPREADNSAGGQVWVPAGKWGPLAGEMLHLSYGRCQMLHIMPQTIGDVMQAGAVDFGLRFLSGVCRGRFHPVDGHLYVVGLNGWQTAAKRDGCLQRVRYTGKSVRMATGLAVDAEGIQVRFAQPLKKAKAEDITSWKLEQWNYRWSADYGSLHWSVARPNQVGEDRLTVSSAKLADDGKSVYLRVPGLQPVMQMRISYSLDAADGSALEGKLYNTIHATGTISGDRK